MLPTLSPRCRYIYLIQSRARRAVRLPVHVITSNLSERSAREINLWWGLVVYSLSRHTFPDSGCSPQSASHSQM